MAIGKYTDDFYKSSRAVYENTFGNGKAYYAAFEHNGDFHADFVNDIIAQAELPPAANIRYDQGICIRKREGNGENYYFILNETEAPKTITLDKQYINMLTSKAMNGAYTMPPQGFYILTDI